MSFVLERKPLEASDLPPQLQKNVDPKAPPPLKMMAARGMLPAPPDQMIKVLYQLHFDADDAVRQEVAKSVKDMPDNILLPVVQGLQVPHVLDWLADSRNGSVLEAVILNKATDDMTVARLASKADAAVCDIIANNQVRVLRTPAIIEELYKNPNARMATVDKLIDLARRNDIDLSALPGLQAALESGEDLSGQGEVDDDAFAAILQTEAAKAAEDDAKLARLESDDLTRSERDRLREKMEEEEEKKRSKGNLHSQISAMTVAQKVRLATVGSREAINILVRDTNKLIHMAAIRSPRLRIGDIRKLSANKSLPDGVIKYIASNKDWTRHYDILVNLVHHPKTPLSDVLGFLNHMRAKELRDVARSRNIPQQVSRMARSLMTKRSGR